MNSKPNHIVRFEKLQTKGRLFYIVSTAFLVAALISAIQWFNNNQPDWRSVALYAFLGAVIAQIDWLFLAKRYQAFHQPPRTESK